MAKGRVSIVVERCKACGFCVESCPTHVLALSSAFNSNGCHPLHVVHPEKRGGCDLCGMHCPDFAIYATKVPGAKHPEVSAKRSNLAANCAVRDIAVTDLSAFRSLANNLP